MVTPARSRKPPGIIAGILGLSSINVVTQALGAGSQLLLAFWLTPSDYGVWATASAWTAILLGLANFGEVNGYLSRGGARLRESLRKSLGPNFVLAAVAMALAMGVWLRGEPLLALVIALCALNIPIQGMSSLLFAAMIKHRFRRRLAVTQLVASACRFTVMLLIAWTTGSPIAFAMGMVTMSILSALGCALALRHRVEASVGMSAARRPRAWTAQAVSQMLAGQSDYLALSVVAAPAVLGLYFFSYQATVALTAMMVPILSRTVMAELSRIAEQNDKAHFAAHVMLRFVWIGAGLAVCAAMLVVIAHDLLPRGWQEAAPLLLALLASVPARLTNPISDAVQMAGDRWYRSALVNVIDGVGTVTVIFLMIPYGILMATAFVALWKVVWSLARVTVAFRALGWRKVLRMCLPILLMGVVWVYLAVTIEWGMS